MDADDLPSLLALLMASARQRREGDATGSVDRTARRPMHTRALALVRTGAGRPRRRCAGSHAAGEPASVAAQTLACAIRALTGAVHAKDPYTRAHCERVSLLGESIARELGLPEDVRADVTLGGLVHDVGKIGVPGPLLHKPCRLTRDEERSVQRHPATGEEILRPLLGHRPTVLAIVRSHHERCDGEGYPDRLPGRRIPLPARIIGVADAFDAMTSRRPYRRALPVSAALAELIRHAGTQFDRTCVAALIRLVRRGRSYRSAARAGRVGGPAPAPTTGVILPTTPSILARRAPMGPGPWGTSRPP